MSKHKKSGPLRVIIAFFNLVLILAIAAGVTGYLYYNSSLKPLSSAAEDKEIVIPKGTGARNIGKLLKTEGIIKDDLTFFIYSKLNEKNTKFQAGKYILNSSMSVADIVDKLTKGQAKIDTVKFTIPEGFELRQIVDRLVEEGIADRDALTNALQDGIYDYDFIAEIPEREFKLEGYLYPDTYEIYQNASAEDIISKMLNRFNQVYNDEFKARAQELNMTMDEIITLASIIEREAMLDTERKTVSAVFHNRIKKKMMLQSCATVQFILKERKEVLSYKDLEIDSPYNTYKHLGLPPGPIASPGIKSIEAALYPEDTDYLYFVAKSDGSHVFSRTYKEHLAAQNKINK